MTILDGTLPARPFHPDGFFGTVQVDGQHPRVAALVCHELDVVAISLVGYDTSISAALATLWQRQQLALLLAEGILHPPDLPKPKEEAESPAAATRATSPIQMAEVDRTRFLLGNWDEPTPHQRSF